MSYQTDINNHEAEGIISQVTTETTTCHIIKSTGIDNVEAVKQYESLVENNEENDGKSSDNSVPTSKKKKGLIIDDSDSESDIGSARNSETNIYKFPDYKKPNKLTIADSDTEEEPEDVTVYNKNFSDDIISTNEQPVFVTNSEGKLIPENCDFDTRKSQAARLSLLCDPESSEEEVDKGQNEMSNFSDENEIVPKQSKKKSNQKKRDTTKPKKMTGKRAAELRKEIKSESQRMLREKNISLPYHKPKSYTIKEFLSRRPKFSSALPVNVKAPPSVAMKMSAEQLSLVSKKLKEREKEVKQFYKSESESEGDQDDTGCVPPTDTNVDRKENTESAVENIDNVSKPVLGENKEEPSSSMVESVPINFEAIDDKVVEEKNTDLLQNNDDNVGLSECDNVIEKVPNDEAMPDKEQELIHTSDMHSNTNDNLNKGNAFHEEVISLEKCTENAEANVSCAELKQDNYKDKELNSMDYEFNLDGLEENSESIVETEIHNQKNHFHNQKNNFQYTDLDKEIEHFGSDDNQHSAVESAATTKSLSKLDLIKEQVANIRPKLTGGPDEVIDLESGIVKPNEVSKLMERFAEHNFKKPVHKNKVQLSIISFESGEIHKETVAMNLEDDETILVEEKPGAKLQRLRDELQNQMAQKRSEIWQKKSTKQSDEDKNIYDGEKESCVLEDDILDDEEEELEMSESSEEDEEEEETDITEKEKKKSAFIDEEAEESDEEGALIEEYSEDEEGNAEDENEVDNLSESEVDNEVNSTDLDNTSVNQSTCKTYRKILKGFTEDSDDEESISKQEEIKNFTESGDTFTQDEDLIPPHQPQNSQKQTKQLTPKKSMEFLTPVSYITGLQNLNNTASKNLKDSPLTTSFRNTNEPSPLKEDNWQRNLQKKLFMDMEITNSQVEELCSGKFPDTQEISERKSLNEEEESHTNDIFQNDNPPAEACGGAFSTSSELMENRQCDQTPSSQELLNICSGEFTGVTQNDEEKSNNIPKNSTYLLNTNEEVKSLDEDQDLIISQLIDEEEMERFKKRFESPLISNTQRRIVEEFEEAAASGGVIDSDDETDTVEVKRKNKKRLMFSDDEASDDEKSEDEVIDLHDNVEDDEESDVSADNVAYDSEENEIELVDEGASAKLKPSDFFENEAELSESEWGSADEDEKDLDMLEFEQGDDEKFDEKKIRSDLEKIHMRQMLDDDTRQVKLLQEMLLEDGELHGSGRERQFKWKNIDSVLETDEKGNEEEDIYLDEEESEEQWRKKRHEREMFLQDKLKQSQNLDDDDDLSESQLLKIGQKVLQRSQSTSQGNTPIEKTKSVASDSPILKQSFTLLNKRGSFLSRSDQVLQRLAEYNKVNSVTVGMATAKNSRNFLFQTVTMEEKSVITKDKKRKAVDGTPNAIKRLRLSNNLSPAIKKKPTAKSKLFSNW